MSFLGTQQSNFWQQFERGLTRHLNILVAFTLLNQQLFSIYGLARQVGL